MPPNAPAAMLIARFRAEVEALADGATGPIGLAVSGGGDSVAMLLLGCAAFPERVRVATVDHRLRPESAGEAASVGRLCEELGVPHQLLALEAPPAGRGGLQAAARDARYAALTRWATEGGCALLATAHHADDQAETLLMRLTRGAGLPGLAGIRPARPLGDSGVRLIRPLLKWRKAELAAIVADAELDVVDDPSNHAPRFDRTRARLFLARTPEARPARLAAAASHLADCDVALAWAAEAAWALRAVEEDGKISLSAENLPREIRRRLVIRAIEQVRAPDAGRWREDGVGRLIATLERGGKATLAGVAARGGDPWRFAPAPPRRV